MRIADFGECPITGRKITRNIISGHFQPAECYSSAANPDGLNERITAAGYNPAAFYEHDGAIPVVAHLTLAGERVAAVVPARDCGRFGGWQVVPLQSRGGKQSILSGKVREIDYDSVEWAV